MPSRSVWRKAAGATRAQLVVQFLAESLFYSALALAVALLVAWQLVPPLGAFLQREVTFDFLRDPPMAATIVGLWLVVGLAAGAYPALVLSMFRPVTVLKGMASLPGGPGRFRQALVILQFGTLVALLVATITIHRQTRFALEDQLRVPGDQVFRAPFTCGVAPGLRDIIATVPGVTAASCAAEWEQTGASMVFATRDGGVVNVRALHVDTHYLQLLGIEPLAGRLLDDLHGEDTTIVLPTREAQAAAPQPRGRVERSRCPGIGIRATHRCRRTIASLEPHPLRRRPCRCG